MTKSDLNTSVFAGRAAHGRRSFFKTAAGALTAGFVVDETLEALPQNTNTNSKPSDLKITDMRIATLRGAPMTSPIIRIDTNQGIYGLGEVRDGASKNYALELKSRILNENPCNIDKVFRKIKQFGGHARQDGGVSAVEVALWDLSGKAYNVPIYQMLGGKFRDRIRIYCDTTESHDPKVYGQRLKERKEQGFTWLKMDLGIDLMTGTPGTLTRPEGAGKRALCATAPKDITTPFGRHEGRVRGTSSAHSARAEVSSGVGRVSRSKMLRTAQGPDPIGHPGRRLQERSEICPKNRNPQCCVRRIITRRFPHERTKQHCCHPENVCRLQ